MHFLDNRRNHPFAITLKSGAEVKITVCTFLSTKWYVDINARHFMKINRNKCKVLGITLPNFIN